MGLALHFYAILFLRDVWNIVTESLHESKFTSYIVFYSFIYILEFMLTCVRSNSHINVNRETF